ncbi:MAG: ankyrin repeat domain-containing protein [Legionellaceae bacterium]|nr:ankyrin repeat domain-containing protein [Legionellaceae bacterium]
MPYKTIQESLEATDTITWEDLGSGNYNQTFISTEFMSSENFTGPWVLKEPRVSSDSEENALNTTDRAIRKWNLHNPEYPAHKTSEGWWVIPYFGAIPASDQQISDKLIEIYQNTGNIITDACGQNNFLIHQGTVICIDVDFSLRRGSFASDPWLEGELLANITTYLGGWRHVKPKTTAMIRTLLYLDQHLLTKPIEQDPTITKSCIAEYMHMQLTDLMHAQAIGPIEFRFMVQFIKLHKQSLLDCVGASGYTLLHLAESLGYEQERLYLLKQGVEQNIAIPTAIPKQTHLIHIAASTGQTTVVKKLMSQDRTRLNALTPLNESPLLIAASRGYHDLVTYLMASGADLNLATQHPQHHYTALDWAITHGHVKTVQLLDSVGAQANYDHVKIKDRNLKQLIKADKLSHIQILIQHNPVLLNQMDEAGYLPVQIASKYGQTNILRYFLDLGANLNHVTPDKQNKYPEIIHPNMTAFEIAVSKNQYRCAILLLDKGASIPQAVPGKNHLIHLAVKAGDTARVQKLITHDSSLLHALSYARKTPLDYARRHGHSDIILLIENALQLQQIVQSDADANTSTATATSTTPSWCAYLTHALWSSQKKSNSYAKTKTDQTTGESLPMLEHIKRS